MNSNTSHEKPNSRIDYFDFFRAIAVYAVIIAHFDALSFYNTDVRTFGWQVLAVYDSIPRWTVPVYMMISGALFLRSSASINKILSKYFLRIIIAYFFWSTAYALIRVYCGELTGTKNIMLQIIKGPDHLWYLPVIAGLYLATPLLRKLIDSQEILNYTLIITLILSSILPLIVDTIALFSDPLYEIFTELQGLLWSYFFHGGIFYFLCGYELNKREIGPKLRKGIYIIGIISLIFTIVATLVISVWKEQATIIYFSPCGINTVLMSIAVFVFGKYHFSYTKVPKLVATIISQLSKKSFGIYLTHVIVIRWLHHHFGIYPLMANPIFFVPLISAVVLIISFAITAVIQSIPILKKYIV